MNLNLGHIHSPLSQRECVFAVPGTRLYTLELGFGGHNCELKLQVEALCDVFSLLSCFPSTRERCVCLQGWLPSQVLELSPFGGPEFTKTIATSQL